MSTRTTLTLDDDVESRLRDLARTTGASFKEVVNRALRRGLLEEVRPPAERFVVEARPMHARPGFDFDDIGALLEQVEGEDHR